MTLALFALAVVLSAAFSGLETGIYTTSRLRLFLDARSGIRAAARARALLTDMPELLTILLVANNMANQAATLLAQQLLDEWDVGSRAVVGTLGVSAILFIFAESVPKSAFRRRKEELLYPCLPVLLVARTLLRHLTLPVTWCARLLESTVRRRSQSGGGDLSGAQSVLLTGAAEGFLTSFQQRVAEGVLEMRSGLAADAALDISHFPVARIGRQGLVMPENCRDHRALVLAADGRSVVGWAPLAALWSPQGPREPKISELSKVTVVEPATTLDRVYINLDRSGAQFAVLHRSDGLAVLDVSRLRQRIMGTLPSPRE
ncbi:MAG: CBS domain containing-hemolysin-like protein [Pseudohongiellaceae bacterium]|jgi:CBS domain containing-hemolysin-like protein